MLNQDKVEADVTDLGKGCEGLVIQIKTDSVHGSTISIHDVEDTFRDDSVATHRQVIQVSSLTTLISELI